MASITKNAIQVVGGPHNLAIEETIVEDDWDMEEDEDCIEALKSAISDAAVVDIDATEVAVQKENKLLTYDGSVIGGHVHNYNVNQSRRAHVKAVKSHMKRYFNERSGC